MRKVKLRIFDGEEMRDFPCVTEWDISDYNLFSSLTQKGNPVLEYSGIDDEFRNELFEGDIVSNHVATWEITFNKGCFCAKRIGDKNNQETHIALRAVKEIKLIGNRYKNPELLK